MQILMTIASAPAPPFSGAPSATPAPSTLYTKEAAHDAWRALCGSTPGVSHHPTIPFHITDADGWTFELILWGSNTSHDGTQDTYTIRVHDEEGYPLGYL